MKNLDDADSGKGKLILKNYKHRLLVSAELD